jgi:hypothetical protein
MQNCDSRKKNAMAVFEKKKYNNKNKDVPGSTEEKWTVQWSPR